MKYTVFAKDYDSSLLHIIFESNSLSEIRRQFRIAKASNQITDRKFWIENEYQENIKA